MPTKMSSWTASSSNMQQHGAPFADFPSHHQKSMMEAPARTETGWRYAGDVFFFGYYVFQIVSTLALDMQGTFPASFYPSWMRPLHSHHLETWRDPWLANTLDHPWYFSICLFEYTLQVPFFFVAAYAYYKRLRGQDQCSWIRIPVIMYSVQTITSVTSVICMALMADFSTSRYLAPTNFFERLKLAGMYSTFFVVCLIQLLDALFAKSYQNPPQQHRHAD